MRKVVCLILCLMLVGCSSLKGDDGVFRNRAKDYKASYLIKPLEIPPHLASVSPSDQYPIPSDVPLEDEPVDLEPPFFDDTEMM